MALKHFTAVTTILFALAFIPRASAEPAADVARDWGLLGTWAVDCSASPKKGVTSFYTYTVTSAGTVTLKRDNEDFSFSIIDARIGPDHTLVLTMPMPQPQFKTTRESSFTKDANGDLRPVYNRDKDTGVYSIQDGLIVANGNPVPSLHKCK